MITYKILNEMNIIALELSTFFLPKFDYVVLSET